MSLTNLAQIKGGLQLKADVEALQKSYDAAKVLTTIAKTVAAGEDPANYNVNELLAELKSQIDSISGGSELSLESLQLAINGLKDKKIKDMVRMEFPVTSGVATLPSDFDTLVPSCDKTKALPVYSADNEVIFDENGNQLTINVETGALSGTPSVIDADASAADKDGKTIYKAKGDFTAKIFPVGEWKLSDLPTDALLDNSEMQLVAYKTALDKLVIELTRDKTLIETVKEKVGEKAVQDQLDEALKAINDAVALKADKTAVEALDTKVDGIDNRVKAIEAGLDEPVSDKIAITAAATEFVISKVPNAKQVEMVINHLTYLEGEDFTVDRDAKKITWTLTAASGGFDIDAELTDAVRVNYYAAKGAPSSDTGAGGGSSDSGSGSGGSGSGDSGESGSGGSGSDESGGSGSGGSDPTPTPDPEPAPDPGPTPDPEPTPADGSWEANVTIAPNTVSTPLSSFLTAEQLAVITDENCAGPDTDGVGRKVHVYWNDVELAWNEEAATPNAEVEAALEATGLKRGMDYVYGSYELDESKVLMFAAGPNGATVKIKYIP